MFLNQFHTVCQKIKTEFFGKLGNCNVFSAQNQVVSKKKQVFTEIETDFSAEVGNSNVFSAQNQVVSKKKKRSSPKLRLIFRPKSEIQTFEGGLFSFGRGLFSIFHKKSVSKAPKTGDFAYFTSQWGRLEPPRPTLLAEHPFLGVLFASLSSCWATAMDRLLGLVEKPACKFGNGTGIQQSFDHQLDALPLSYIKFVQVYYHRFAPG